MTFLLPLYLQQVAGYTPVDAGLTLLPVTVIMFSLSRRAGELADRIGPRLPMGLGPLVAAAGILLLLLMDQQADYLTQVLPGLVVFGLGLTATVAPLTSTVLGAVEQEHAGVASGVNNALARVAGLLAVAVLGAAVSATFTSRLNETFFPGQRLDPPARAAIAEAKKRPLGGATLKAVPLDERPRLHAAFNDASEDAFHVGIIISAGLAATGGIISLIGIVNPRRKVEACDCPGGAFVGASEDVAHVHRPPAPEPAGAAS
jgi:hypothetical protein